MTCPSVVLDIHHAGTRVGLVRTRVPAWEPGPDLARVPGTLHCVYAHEYRDAKGRLALHEIEVRVRDGEKFHSFSLVMPRKK